MYASSSIAANSPTTLASAQAAQIIGASNVATDAGTSLALSVPAGAGVGDLLLIVTSLRGTTTTIAGPAGWTGHTQYSQGTTISQRVHHNFAASSDLTATHTVTFGATPVKAAAVLLVVRGVQGTPWLTSAGLANASATTIAVPGLTMAAQSVLLLIGASKAHSDPHSAASGFVLDPAATVASGPAGATAHRLSVHTRSSAIADPPATTIAAGAVAAVSVGVQMAALLGPSGAEQMVASPASYATTGALATLLTTPYIETLVRGTYTQTGAPLTEVYTATWTTLATLGSTAAFYSDLTCAPSTTYTYRVIATNALASTTSNEASATTFSLGASFSMLAGPGVYLASDALVGTTFANESLDATPAAYATTGAAVTLENPALVYEVIDTVSGASHSYSDIGLTPSTWYVYRVVAVNTVAETASNLAVVQTLAATTTNFPLTAASGGLALGGATLGALAFRMPCLPASYVTTGRLTTEIVGHDLPALPAAYVATPATPSLTTALFLSALKGAYVQTGVAASVARVFVGQQAVPIADISDGGWTPSAGVDLYPTIDEASDDAPVDSDYIRTVNPIADEAVVDLTDLQTPRAGDVLILVRTRQV